MKNLFLNILAIAIPICLASCAGLTLSSQQQTALNDVGKTALDAGLGYLNGGQAGAIAGAAPDLAGDVSDAALALRTTETPGATTTPSASQINSVIASISGSPAVAKALGPKVSAAIKTAVISGTPPNVAIETAAKGLDKAAAKS